MTDFEKQMMLKQKQINELEEQIEDLQLEMDRMKLDNEIKTKHLTEAEIELYKMGFVKSETVDNLYQKKSVEEDKEIKEIDVYFSSVLPEFQRAILTKDDGTSCELTLELCATLLKLGEETKNKDKFM